MPISRTIPGAWRTVCPLVAALCLTLLPARPATAAVLYDFSLEPNGSVGAVHIVARFDDFLPPSGLLVLSVTDPDVATTSETPIDPDSILGLDVLPASTLFGVALYKPGLGDLVLLTRDYPDDFFVFARTPTETGTFLSMAGLVESPLGLDTGNPVATLVVTQVPEPATVGLLGLASLGVIVRRRRQG